MKRFGGGHWAPRDGGPVVGYSVGLLPAETVAPYLRERSFSIPGVRPGPAAVRHSLEPPMPPMPPMPPPTVDPSTPRQVIPRPAASRAGLPARGAEGDEPRRRSIGLERVRAAVAAGGGWVAGHPD